MGNQGREDAWQGGGWWTGQVRRWLEDWVVPYSHVDKPGGTMEIETDHTTQGSSAAKERLGISGCKNLWGLWQHEKLLASQESLLGRPTGS